MLTGKLTFTLKLSTTLILLLSNITWPCSCLKTAPVETRYANYDKIFTGKLIGINPNIYYSNINSGTNYSNVYYSNGTVISSDVYFDVASNNRFNRKLTFDVIELFKGDYETNLEITTGFGGGDCGLFAELSNDYLIFAYIDSQDDLRVHICSGSGNIKYNSNSYADIINELRSLKNGRDVPVLSRRVYKSLGHMYINLYMDLNIHTVKIKIIDSTGVVKCEGITQVYNTDGPNSICAGDVVEDCVLSVGPHILYLELIGDDGSRIIRKMFIKDK